MNRFMILALALVLWTVAATQPLLATQPIAGVTLSWIGECLAEPGLFLEENQQRRALPPLGHVHEFA